MNVSEVTVRVVRRYNTTAERVFDAWLDPKHAGTWLFATTSGQRVNTAIDARVGGCFSIVERRDGVDVEHTGEYLELMRPERLSFTFYVPKYSAQPTRVVVDVVARPPGCELTLTHACVLAEYSSATEAGWTQILDGLARTLGC